MRRFAFIIALAVVLAAFQTAPATESGNAEVSDELRAALKAPIGKKIKQLLEKKDDLGASYVYGSYYDDFTKVGDGYAAFFCKG